MLEKEHVEWNELSKNSIKMRLDISPSLHKIDNKVIFRRLLTIKVILSLVVVFRWLVREMFANCKGDLEFPS